MWLKNIVIAMIVLCLIGYLNRDRIFFMTGEYHERNQFYIAAYQAYKKIPQYCPGSPLTKKAREKMIELSKMSDVKTFVEKNEKDVKIIQEKREKLDSFR